jgi:hypothetical protein
MGNERLMAILLVVSCCFIVFCYFVFGLVALMYTSVFACIFFVYGAFYKARS